MTSIRKARKIIGKKRFLGPKDVSRYFLSFPWYKTLFFWLTRNLKNERIKEKIQSHFGINPWWVGEIPFSEDELKQGVTYDYILVAGYPIDIPTMKSMQSATGKIKYNENERIPSRKENPWYQDNAFLREKVEFRWYFLRRKMFQRHRKDTFYYQLRYLKEEGLQAPEVYTGVYVLTFYYLKTGKWIISRGRKLLTSSFAFQVLGERNGFEATFDAPATIEIGHIDSWYDENQISIMPATGYLQILNTPYDRYRYVGLTKKTPATGEE